MAEEAIGRWPPSGEQRHRSKGSELNCGLERASDWLPASLSFTSPLCPNDARTRAMDASTTHHWFKRCLERAGLSTEWSGYLHPGLDRLAAAMKQAAAEVVSSNDSAKQPNSR
jgi:hypothetical protein